MKKTEQIGVVGAGTMGLGIAHVFIQYGYQVFLVDQSHEILNNALRVITINIDRQVNRNIISDKNKEIALANLTLTTSMNILESADLVIEAVSENIKIKGEIFKALDSICKKDAILASNTSSISIQELANFTNREAQCIGMHFMNPVPIMKLVEVVYSKKTSTNTLEKIFNYSHLIEKVPVKCFDSPGFISNRILMPMINEAAFCLMEKIADVDSIDQIMHLGMSHPMGPLRLADLIGIDICVDIMNILFDGFKNKKYSPCPLLLRMVKEGKLGKKTNEGFYKY